METPPSGPIALRSHQHRKMQNILILFGTQVPLFGKHYQELGPTARVAIHQGPSRDSFCTRMGQSYFLESAGVKDKDISLPLALDRLSPCLPRTVSAGISAWKVPELCRDAVVGEPPNSPSWGSACRRGKDTGCSEQPGGLQRKPPA